MDKTNEIREALEAATPGPWRVHVDGYPGAGGWVEDRSIQPDVAGEVYSKPDANLIANAPEWLQWQNAEIERLRKKNEDWKRNYANLKKAYTDEPKGWETLTQFLKKHEVLGEIWEETGSELVRDQCFSLTTHYIRTFEKLLEKLEEAEEQEA